jgi:hypothetical protein
MKLTRLTLGGVLLAVAVLGGTGCATFNPEPREVDGAYIAYVEAAAKRYWTQVIWINLPTRPVAEAAQPADAPATPAKP